MKNKEITEVIFRKEGKDDILAVFPYEIANFKGDVTCYAHIGQHSGMCWGYIYKTKPARPEEYADLKSELEGIGYNLKVIKKRQYKRYNKAFEEMRKRYL